MLLLIKTIRLNCHMEHLRKPPMLNDGGSGIKSCKLDRFASSDRADVDRSIMPLLRGNTESK